MKIWVLLAAAAIAPAQDFTQKGFVDLTLFGYPETAPNDSGLAVGEVWFEYEAFDKLTPNLRLSVGVDARTDTHHQDERIAHFSFLDRERQRPAFELHRLSLAYSHDKLSVEAGKQFIRWGRTDIVTPTDRFAPQDYLNVVDPELLAVIAARLTYGTQTNSIDLVYSPRLTPARIPLLNQRWAVLPVDTAIQELNPQIPNGPQFGARFNHTGSTIEYALSAYQGYDYFPQFHLQPQFFPPATDVQRFYPPMRMYGGDFAVPLSWVTFKGEGAYFSSANRLADDYIIYVMQLERQVGEWSFVAGYAGQTVTRYGSDFSGFSVMRGFTKAIVGRAGYTIDVNRSFSFEAAVRQNGRGVWLEPEYTQAFGQHWRVTAGVAWIHGSPGDFLGQYRRNSLGILRVRYSF